MIIFLLTSICFLLIFLSLQDLNWKQHTQDSNPQRQSLPSVTDEQHSLLSAVIKGQPIQKFQLGDLNYCTLLPSSDFWIPEQSLCGSNCLCSAKFIWEQSEHSKKILLWNQEKKNAYEKRKFPTPKWAQFTTEAGKNLSSSALKTHHSWQQNFYSKTSQVKEGKLARWWMKTPWRWSKEINGLMTAVLFGTAAMLSTEENKSE